MAQSNTAPAFLGYAHVRKQHVILIWDEGGLAVAASRSRLFNGANDAPDVHISRVRMHLHCVLHLIPLSLSYKAFRAALAAGLQIDDRCATSRLDASLRSLVPTSMPAPAFRHGSSLPHRRSRNSTRVTLVKSAPWLVA
jgi:hypothetical protein